MGGELGNEIAFWSFRQIAVPTVMAQEVSTDHLDEFNQSMLISMDAMILRLSEGPSPLVRLPVMNTTVLRGGPGQSTYCD